MAQQTSITAYDTPSGMGGSFTVSILEDRGETALVRIWYGSATAKGWESWGEWDGVKREVTKDKLTNEREKKLFRAMADDPGAQLFMAPYTANGYEPSQVYRKYIKFWIGSDYLRMEEVNDKAETIKTYPAALDELTQAQVDEARSQQHAAFGSVMVWERNPGANYPNMHH